MTDPHIPSRSDADYCEQTDRMSPQRHRMEGLAQMMREVMRERGMYTPPSHMPLSVGVEFIWTQEATDQYRDDAHMSQLESEYLAHAQTAADFGAIRFSITCRTYLVGIHDVVVTRLIVKTVFPDGESARACVESQRSRPVPPPSSPTLSVPV